MVRKEFLVLGLLAFLACGQSKSPRNASYEATYVVEGQTDAASLTYRNQGGGTEQVDTNVPWRKSFPVHPGDTLYLSAQNKEESGSVIVRILVNDQIVKESQSLGAFKIASASYRCCY